MSRPEDLCDFPCSGDFEALFRETEGGPRAVGTWGYGPPPPIVQRVKDPLTVKIFVPQRFFPKVEPKSTPSVGGVVKAIKK